MENSNTRSNKNFGRILIPQYQLKRKAADPKSAAFVIR